MLRNQAASAASKIVVGHFECVFVSIYRVFVFLNNFHYNSQWEIIMFYLINRSSRGKVSVSVAIDIITTTVRVVCMLQSPLDVLFLNPRYIVN